MLSVIAIKQNYGNTYFDSRLAFPHRAIYGKLAPAVGFTFAPTLRRLSLHRSAHDRALLPVRSVESFVLNAMSREWTSNGNTLTQYCVCVCVCEHSRSHNLLFIGSAKGYRTDVIACVLYLLQYNAAQLISFA